MGANQTGLVRWQVRGRAVARCERPTQTEDWTLRRLLLSLAVAGLLIALPATALAAGPVRETAVFDLTEPSVSVSAEARVAHPTADHRRDHLRR